MQFNIDRLIKIHQKVYTDFHDPGWISDGKKYIKINKKNSPFK